MHRARTLHDGHETDINSQSNQEHVQQKLQEEADGMMISIQVMMELEKIGLVESTFSLPLEDLYCQAFLAASDQAKKSDPFLRELQLELIGRSSG